MPWKLAKKQAVAQERSEEQAEHLSWKVPYQPGTLRAVGRQKGQVVCAKKIHTAGTPAQIRLSRMMPHFLDDHEIPPLVADGRDGICHTFCCLLR